MNKTIITLLCIIILVFGIFHKPIYEIEFKQGQKFLKEQSYVKAYKSLKKAYNLNKSNKNYKYYYVQSLKHLSPTYTIQKEVFEIANSNENDSAQLEAESLILQWRNQILRDIGDNYIEQAANGQDIIRWDINKLPLKTIIINESNISLPPYYETEIQKAITQWQDSVSFLKFQSVDKENDADIIIKITPTPKDICTESECKYVAGYTTPEIRGKLLRKMTIVIYAKDPGDNFLSDKELYNVTLHEMGHALGIMGHSYSSSDLMYMKSDNNNAFYIPYRSTFQYLSSKDINTIKLLYKIIPTISNTSIDKLDIKGMIFAPIIFGTSEQVTLKKIKEAQYYIKNAPDMASGYIDLGIAYAQIGKHKDAIDALKKALKLAKTNEDKFIVSYNMALVYMEDKKYEKAMTYAQMAKEIKNDEDVENLIIQINHNKNK